MNKTTNGKSMRQLFMSIVAVVVMLISINTNNVFAEDTFVAKVGSASYSTLAEAINSANDGSTIEIMRNCKLDNNVLIDKDLTIKSIGDSPLTITPTSIPENNRAAIIVTGHELNLSNVVIDGCELNATAIIGVNGATITLGKDCTITNINTTKNENPDQYNGAIRLNNTVDQKRSTLNMTSNSRIIDCISRNGAACYVLNSDVVMSGSALVSNCKAEYHKESDGVDQPGCGGAFRFLESENEKCVCNFTMTDNASIKNCHASFYGGAFVFDNIAGTANLSGNAVLSDNECNGEGGAIYIPRGTLNIEGNTKFENNRAQRGGAIYASGMNQRGNLEAHAKVNILGGTITNNSASKYGAGIVINRYAEASISGSPYIRENVDATGKDGKGNFYVAADPKDKSDTKLLIDFDDNSTMNVGIMGYNSNENKDYCSNAVNGQFTNRLPKSLDGSESEFNKYASKDFTGHVFNDANPDVYVEAMELGVNDFWDSDGLYWRVNTVTYLDGCNGEAFESQVYHPGLDEEVPNFKGTPCRNGYKFVGWDETKKSPDGSKAYTITRTAKWKKVNMYIVTYKNGYSETPIEKFTVNENEKTPTVDDPVRDGYVFDGWDKDIVDTVTGDATYTANWEKLPEKFTVTYKDGDKVLQTTEVEKDALTPTVGNPVKDGYKFVGWTPAVAKTVTEDVTYTAKWEKVVVPNKEVKEPAKKDTPTTGDSAFVSAIIPCALIGLGLFVWSKKH